MGTGAHHRCADYRRAFAARHDFALERLRAVPRTAAHAPRRARVCLPPLRVPRAAAAASCLGRRRQAECPWGEAPSSALGDRSERIGQCFVRLAEVDRATAIGQEPRQQRHAAGVDRPVGPQARREVEQARSRFEDLATGKRDGNRTGRRWVRGAADEGFEADGELLARLPRDQLTRPQRERRVADRVGAVRQPRVERSGASRAHGLAERAMVCRLRPAERRRGAPTRRDPSAHGRPASRAARAGHHGARACSRLDQVLSAGHRWRSASPGPSLPREVLACASRRASGMQFRPCRSRH